jgi:hypothetical protein
MVGTATFQNIKLPRSKTCFIEIKNLNDLAEVALYLWPIALFALAAGAVALKRYRQTLD